MTTILTDDFKTELGIVSNWIDTDGNSINQLDNFTSVTIGHKVYLQIIDLKEIWLPDGMEYSSAKVWRWFIDKINKQTELLTIYCRLIDPSADTEFGGNPGEHLDAIEIENKTHHLHIGIEDG